MAQRARWRLGLVVAALAASAQGQNSPAPPSGAAPVRRLTHDGAFKQHLAWSPDGSRIAYTRQVAGEIAIWVVPVGGGEPRRLTTGPPKFQPAWHPSGRRLAFVHVSIAGTDGTLDIRTMGVEGEEITPLVPAGSHVTEHPAWSPDGRRIAFSSTRHGNRELYLADYDPERNALGEIRRLTNDPAEDSRPTWSPDGTRLAFQSDRNGSFDLYTIGADGEGLQRLTDHPALDSSPAWSPDGEQIAFVSTRDGNQEIYLIARDGSRPRNLSRFEGSDHSPAWHPQGGRLAWVSYRDGGYDLYVLDRIAP